MPLACAHSTCTLIIYKVQTDQLLFLCRSISGSNQMTGNYTVHPLHIFWSVLCLQNTCMTPDKGWLLRNKGFSRLTKTCRPPKLLYGIFEVFGGWKKSLTLKTASCWHSFLQNKHNFAQCEQAQSYLFVLIFFLWGVGFDYCQEFKEVSNVLSKQMQ